MSCLIGLRKTLRKKILFLFAVAVGPSAKKTNGAGASVPDKKRETLKAHRARFKSGGKRT